MNLSILFRILLTLKHNKEMAEKGYPPIDPYLYLSKPAEQVKLFAFQKN